MMCRSGGRSTKAAKHLETDLGFTNVYEIDNPLKEMVVVIL